MYGGDDGARTRDLSRDSEKEARNLQKTSVTDGFFWRSKERSGTVIEPISNPQPLPCRPLPTLGIWLDQRIGLLAPFENYFRLPVIREPLAEPPIVPLTKGLYWEDGNLKYDGLETIFGFQNQGTSTTFGKLENCSRTHWARWGG
jgi:hypothetical protein